MKWYSSSQVWPQNLCLTHGWPQHFLFRNKDLIGLLGTQSLAINLSKSMKILIKLLGTRLESNQYIHINRNYKSGGSWNINPCNSVLLYNLQCPAKSLNSYACHVNFHFFWNSVQVATLKWVVLQLINIIYNLQGNLHNQISWICIGPLLDLFISEAVRIVMI